MSCLNVFPDGQYSSRFEHQHPDGYTWLSEFAEANIQDNDSFHLRKVMVDERIKHTRESRFDRHVWELPWYLCKFASAELGLTVRLRKP